MDRVRFGRALGAGTRAAAKSLLNAAEAAAAPNPSAAKPTPNPTSSQPPRPAGNAPERPAAGRVQMPDPKFVKDQAHNLKRSLWSPVAKFSNVLWLEVTGLFFALFALLTGTQVWKLHAAVRLPASDPGAQHLYLYAFLFALFGYFTISSFVRASRRQRK